MSQQEKSVSGPRVPAICGARHEVTTITNQLMPAIVGLCGMFRQASGLADGTICPDACQGIAELAWHASFTAEEVAKAVRERAPKAAEHLESIALTDALCGIQAFAQRASRDDDAVCGGLTFAEILVLRDLAERAHRIVMEADTELDRAEALAAQAQVLQ